MELSTCSAVLTQVATDTFSNNPRRQPEQYREALVLWLRWDREHLRLTELLFAAGHDQRRVEELLDACESMKARVVELSKSLVGPS
jgi:hypothetical protein